ncbi:type II toxin-antitoxin system YoeB family toxin [Thiocystis violascens]|uniref:Uncharacterized protein n=1 Tax=Thiocystis violascens (strain ATCC 17096 / DSM 198 / 6111) TaxID=765911 RepID=I3Y945_THIV6|nr:type II toxin-antitoxin system YoeB family toxin [Thiocystis violascens]AFL73513.1 hypothetical protein Thivi_1513 [Thiocystis violascens DSM 198]
MAILSPDCCASTLIEEAVREPLAGLGKPEPPLGNPSGYGSRRIDDTHRRVYRATEAELVVIACRFTLRLNRVASPSRR